MTDNTVEYIKIGVLRVGDLTVTPTDNGSQRAGTWNFEIIQHNSQRTRRFTN